MVLWWCGVVWCGEVRSGVVWYGAMRCGVVWCGTGHQELKTTVLGAKNTAIRGLELTSTSVDRLASRGADRLATSHFGLLVKHPPRERYTWVWTPLSPSCSNLSLPCPVKLLTSRMDTPLAALLDTWSSRARAGSGWPGVSIL